LGHADFLGGLRLAKRAYVRAKIWDLASASGGALDAPPEAGMKAGRSFALSPCRGSNSVGRFLRRIKKFRIFAARFDKLISANASFAHLAITAIYGMRIRGKCYEDTPRETTLRIFHMLSKSIARCSTNAEKEPVLMSTTAYSYDLDGAMVAATGETFSLMRRHNYTRLPVEIAGVGGDASLRYDSFGRRLHKSGERGVFYRSGAHHPDADRAKGPDAGNEYHHPFLEYAGGAEFVYLFTPAGQTVLRRACGYARVGRDHLRSSRVEAVEGTPVTAHYGAFGEALVNGGELRRGFAGYEPDIESGLYNANRRFYAPWIRVFVSADPILRDASPYPYCWNDPFNRIDPTGGISSAVISGVVASLVLILSVVLTIATAGAAAPASAVAPVISESVEAGADAGAEAAVGVSVEATGELPGEALNGAAAAGEGLVRSPSGRSLASSIISKLPQKLGSFVNFGVVLGGSASFVSNGAALISEAAQGEHVTAWQAVRSMLIEPVIATAVGAVSGAFDGLGVLAGRGLLFAMGMSGIGEATSSFLDSVASEGLEGQLGMRGTWEQIGIKMAIAATEAILVTGALASTGVYSIEETWTDASDNSFVVRANMSYPALPIQQAESSGTLTLVRRDYGFEPVDMPGTSRSDPGTQVHPGRRLTMPHASNVVRRVSVMQPPRSARPPRVVSDP
jgi:RHS repeat-associated protein